MRGYHSSTALSLSASSRRPTETRLSDLTSQRQINLGQERYCLSGLQLFIS